MILPLADTHMQIGYIRDSLSICHPMFLWTHGVLRVYWNCNTRDSQDPESKICIMSSDGVSFMVTALKWTPLGLLDPLRSLVSP